MSKSKIRRWLRRLLSGKQALPNDSGRDATNPAETTSTGNGKYYLSLEFAFDGTSYWLATSSDGTWLRHFMAFPEAAFEGRPLNPGKLQWAGGNSELQLFGENGDGARFCSVDEQNPETVDLGPFKRLTWNEMCELALARLPTEDWIGLYHPHIIRLRDGTTPFNLHGGKPFPIQDVDYIVSGFLPDEGTLSLMGEDHNPPENNNWKGFDQLHTPGRVREILSQFRVQAIQLGGHYLKVD